MLTNGNGHMKMSGSPGFQTGALHKQGGSQPKEQGELGTIVLSVFSPSSRSLPLEVLRHLGAWGHTRGLIISQPPADTVLSVDTIDSQALSSGEHGASVPLHLNSHPKSEG